MIDLLLALVDQTFGGTNLYIPTILMMLAIGIICFTNKNWLQDVYKRQVIHLMKNTQE